MPAKTRSCCLGKHQLQSRSLFLFVSCKVRLHTHFHVQLCELDCTSYHVDQRMGLIAEVGTASHTGMNDKTRIPEGWWLAIRCCSKPRIDISTCPPSYGDAAHIGLHQPALPLCRCNHAQTPGRSRVPLLMGGQGGEQVGDLDDHLGGHLVSNLPDSGVGAGNLPLGSRHCPQPLSHIPQQYRETPLD